MLDTLDTLETLDRQAPSEESPAVLTDAQQRKLLDGLLKEAAAKADKALARSRVSLRQWLGLSEPITTAGGSTLWGVYPRLLQIAEVFDLVADLNVADATDPDRAVALRLEIATYFFGVNDEESPGQIRPARAEEIESAFEITELCAELRAAYRRNRLMKEDRAHSEATGPGAERLMVGPDWGAEFAILAERYGFTPADVEHLTWVQAAEYLDYTVERPSINVRMIRWPSDKE